MLFRHGRGWGLTRHKIQYTAMVDCVFLLLIFFIAVARVRSLEGDFEASNCPDGNGQMEPVRVWVADADEGPMLRLGGSSGEALTDFPKLTERLSELAGPHVFVVIQGPPEVRLATVTGVLDATQKAGIANLRFDLPSVGKVVDQ